MGITIQDLGFKDREEMEKAMEKLEEACIDCGEIKGHANWCVKSE